MNNGRTIPQLGFGVFQIDPAETAEATSRALKIGYRHIDTAEMYRNEKGVGEAVRSSGIPREQIFVTSKLNNHAHRPDDARRAFDETLAALDLGYVDLFLIHWPLPTRYDGDYVSTWRTMIEFAQDGRARSIGVSNFQVPHLQRIIAETGVTPAINQIEVHPYCTNEEVRAYDRENGILTEAWSPLAQGQVLDDVDPEGGVRCEDEDPGRVLGHAELGLGADHPVGRVPVRLPRRDAEAAGQLGAGQRERHAVAGGEVRGAAHDLALLGPGVDVAEPDRLLEAGQLLDVEDLPDDDAHDVVAVAVDLLDLEAGADEGGVDLVGGGGETGQERAQPGDGHAHVRPPSRAPA